VFGFSIGEPSSGLERHRKDLGEGGGDSAYPGEAGVVADLHAELAAEVWADGLHAFRLVANVDQVRAGDARSDVIPLCPCGVQGYDAVGVGVGKRRQEQRLHDGEDCCISADSQGQREDGGDCKGWTLI